MPITLLLLLVVFGGLVAASLPLFVGVVAVLGTFLSLYVIGSITDVSVYAINLTTALGLGLAIDYSLFIVSRYREELRAGRSVGDAVVRAVETAGRTVAISALTVAVSLAALLVFPQYFLRSFAYAGIAVVLLAMVAAVVALPALLSVVGTRIDAVRRVPAPRPEGRARRVLVPHGAARDAPPARRRASASSTVLLFLGCPFLRRPLRRARRPRAAGVGAVARSPTTRSARASAATPPSTFPIVIDGAATAPPALVDDLAADVSALAGVARVDGARRHVRRRCARRRRGDRGSGAVLVERRGPARRRAGDRDRLAGGRGADPRRARPSRPPLDVAVGGETAAARRHQGVALVPPAGRPGDGRRRRRPSCCSCCRAACSCRSRPSCSTRSA